MPPDPRSRRPPPIESAASRGQLYGRRMAVLLRDVTLRDGLQDEAPVSTDAKLQLFEALVAAGIRDLELTSFVRADRVPAMADAEEMVAATAGSPVTRWG